MKRYFAILLVMLISLATHAQTGSGVYSLPLLGEMMWDASSASKAKGMDGSQEIYAYYYEMAAPANQIAAYSESGSLVVLTTQTATIAVFDMTGRRIARFDSVSGAIRIPVQAGAYIIKASIDNQDYVLKVIVR